MRGRRQTDPVLTGAATYVVFGTGRVQTLGGVVTLADPALPKWLKTETRRRNGRGFMDFLEPLLAAHQSDRRLSGAEWLRYFDTLIGRNAARDTMRSMIERGSDNPVKDLETILRSGNVSIDVSENTITLRSDAI